MNELIVTISGVIGIIFVYWFFLMKKEKKEVAVVGSVDITVEGGYSPEVISVPKDKTTKINFIRKDSSSCLEEVVLPDLRYANIFRLTKRLLLSLLPSKRENLNIPVE